MTLSGGLTPVPGNILSNGILVAVVALLHVQIAAYLTGSSTLAIVSEAVSMARGDERHARLAHMFVTSWVYVFSFGSALAIFFLTFVLTTIWALFYVALQQVAFWPFFFEGLMFILEIVLLYTLYANWERLAVHRRARLGLLVLLNIALWWQMVLINVIASFMITPNGGDVNLLAQVLNPTSLPLTIHRTIGNVAWAGAIVGFVGAFQYLRLTRRSGAPQPQPAAPLRRLRSVGAMAAGHLDEVRSREVFHWEWVAQWGVVWAVALTLLQPWVGYSYAKEIQLHNYAAWYTLMFGDLSNVFLVQIFLLGSVFTLAAFYFQRRMARSGAPRTRTMTFLLVALILMTLLAIQPAWFAPTYADAVACCNKPWWEGGLLNPIGDFIPFKVSALIGMVIFGLWALTSYLSALSRGHIRPGSTSRRTGRIVVVLGLVLSAMMIVMGVLREHSRQPYLIDGEITIQGQHTLNTAPSVNSVQQAQP